jgi:hypothetical protein
MFWWPLASDSFARRIINSPREHTALSIEQEMKAVGSAAYRVKFDIARPAAVVRPIPHKRNLPFARGNFVCIGSG